jgi:hypothetical protein
MRVVTAAALAVRENMHHDYHQYRAGAGQQQGMGEWQPLPPAEMTAWCRMEKRLTSRWLWLRRAWATILPGTGLQVGAHTISGPR